MPAAVRAAPAISAVAKLLQRLDYGSNKVAQLLSQPDHNELDSLSRAKLNAGAAKISDIVATALTELGSDSLRPKVPIVACGKQWQW